MSNKNQTQPSTTSHKVGTVIGIILCVIFSIIIIFNSVLIIRSLTGDVAPSVGGNTPLIVQSDSMTPTIMKGDLIVCKEIDPTLIKKGDIVSFYYLEKGEKKVITHRVVDVINDNGSLKFQTKGDMNNDADQELRNASDVVGIFDFRIPGLGDVSMFLQTVPGIILCVGLPLLILIVYEVLRRRKYDQIRTSENAVLMAELDELKKKQQELEGKTESNQSQDVNKNQ